MTKIILALDDISKNEILAIVNEFKGTVAYKVHDSVTKHEPQIIEEIQKLGGEVFWDTKLFDIPNTIANYTKAICEKKVLMFNIHCLGGFEMMKAARDTVDKYCAEHKLRKPLILGVTILTSINEETMKNELKINLSLNDMVIHLAKLAKKAGLDGVVCSPKEIDIVKKACGKDFITVTPGIRPAWSEAGDQKRIMTPSDAKAAGTDYIVIGRPIIQAQKFGMTRKEAAKRIIDEMN